MSDERLRDLERRWEAAPDDSEIANAYLTACDRSAHPLVEAIRNQLLRAIHRDRIPENLRDILEQYQGNRARLQRFGIVTIPEDPGQLPYITGIDGKQYPVPTFEQVITQITAEDKLVIETIDHPKLLLTPFAASLQEFGQRLTSQSGNLPQQNPLESSWDQNADRTGDLLYRVNQFTDPVGGMTKQQVLQLPREKNLFPGWNVLAVKGQPEIDRQTIVKEEGGYKNAHDFLKEYKDKKYDGLSPEDMLALHMLAMESGMPFNQRARCWLLDCYLKLAQTHPYYAVQLHAVPITGWNVENSQVRQESGFPQTGWGGEGSRGARRVGSGR